MVDSPIIIYIIGAIIAVVIIIMSLVFLFKAVRRAKAIGMDKKVVTETIKNSALFSIAIPWIRLTVIGALQYEMLAMSQAHVPAGGGDTAAIATAVVIMTLAILTGPIFNAIFYKKYQNKLYDLQKKNERKMDAITGAMLGGMLSGIMSAIIVGAAFGVGNPVTDDAGITSYGEITLITLAASIVITGICGAIMIFGKQKWMESYALPLSILGSLAIAFAFVPVFA